MKQAYLIIVHKENYVLEKLIESIDSKHNDIYIHVDKKNVNFNFERYSRIPQYSKLIFLKNRIDVKWGGFEQVEVEIQLLKTATKNGDYSYYHLLSGQDLPIKENEYIYNFFDLNNKIYIDYERIKPVDMRTRKIYRRRSVRRFFIKYRQSKNIISRIMINLDRLCMLFQEYILKIDYIKLNDINLAYGSQWFSIPDDVAHYLISQENKIRREFKNAYIPDELFMQTTVMQKYKNRLAVNNARLIDFEHGEKNTHPYIWRIDDYEKLICSDRLFARKFDENVDKKIIKKISNYTKRG